MWIGATAVAWSHVRRGDPAEADDLIRWACTIGFDRSIQRTGRLCATCGASTHGQPMIRATGPDPLYASVSRSGAHLAVAVGPYPVGIDVEAHHAPLEQGHAWVVAEAALKAVGTGFEAGRAGVAAAVARCRIDLLTAPPGFDAALAVLQKDEVRLADRVDRAAPPSA